MRYAGIIKNDFAAAPGVCLSFFVQGCPLHCYKCQNPDTWNFDGGKEFTPEVLDEIEEGLTANGIHRTLCIMGGEPLCDDNLFLTQLVIREIKKRCPWVKIWVWTGYDSETIFNTNDAKMKFIINEVDGLVTGPYIDSLRDITLPMRGSSNQEVINLTN